jgi:hypothetical protein
MKSGFDQETASWRNKIETRDLIFFFIGCVFIYLHLFILPATPIFYEEDHLYFLHDAWRMYEGEAIYRDFFQIMFPGGQLLYLLLFYIFGTKFWIVNAVIFLQASAHVLLALGISKRIFGSSWRAYLPPSLYLFFGFRWFGIDGTHRVLSPLFIYLAVFVLLKSRSLRRIAIAGALCGLSSFFTQQRGLLAIGAIAVFLFYEAVKNRKFGKNLLVSELVLMISFGLTLTILILPFIISAGPQTFFDYTFFFIRNYVQDSTGNYLSYFNNVRQIFEQGILISAVTVFYCALIPLVYLISFFYLLRRKYNSEVKAKSEIFLITLVGFFLTLGTFAPNPYRFFQIVIPALIVLVWLISQLKIKSESVIRAAVVGLIILGMALAFRLQTNWEKNILASRTGNIVFLSPVVLERYKWLSENTVENEYVFEVYQCAVNFVLQLRNPTQVTFLLNTGYTPVWQVTQSIENLERKKPRFIIWDGAWTRELETIEEGEHLGPLYDYLRQNYELKKEFTPYNNREMQLWERKQ